MENQLFDTAWQIVNYTGRNLFLTGKAGTGKTTFLKKVVAETTKKSVVVAPTGVAAINAGGVTMHSLFQLPFQPYIRNGHFSHGEIQFVNRSSLFKSFRFSKEKIELINELELLIIDEVSMLRADMLDAINDTMQHIRENRRDAFGGAQVLFIGDLFQLPPVVVDSEIKLMSEYYETPFFFSAEVLKENPPTIVELKKIYRQSDEKFIHLLNNIRNNEVNEHDSELLHSRYKSNDYTKPENVVTLCTHNAMADKINREELNKLDSPVHKFTAETEGEFNEKALPTERVLELKNGAQVMFIRNDSSGKKKYYNGRLATIVELTKEKIIVKMADNNSELELEKEKWENIKYVFNKEENKVDEHSLGSFSQFPIRLAWAITIHKSQGLTFKDLLIDAGASFAPGQVYVALSRCTTLEGLVLLSKISADAIKTDERILDFAQRETNLENLNLEEEKFDYTIKRLYRFFDWRNVLNNINEFAEFTMGKTFAGKEKVIAVLKTMSEKATEQNEVAKKFIQRVNEIVSKKPIQFPLLEDRVKKAKTYFMQRLHEEIILPLKQINHEFKPKQKTKQFIKQLKIVETDLWRKTKEIEKVDVSGLDLTVHYTYRDAIFAAGDSAADDEKIPSKNISLNHYRQKKTAEEIAEIRGITVSTVEGHLAEFVTSGEVNVFDFISDEQFQRIKNTVETNSQSYETFKTYFQNEISYGKWKMSLIHLRNQENTN